MGGKITMERSAEDAVAVYSVVDDVMSTLAKSGITLPDPPKWEGDLYDGQLPPNIDDLADDDLSELLTVTVGWKNFLLGQVRFFKGCRDQAAKQVKIFRAYLRKQKRDAGLLDGTSAKWVLDDELERDSRYQDIQREELYFTTYSSILDACYEAAESDWSTVSRNITLRGQSRSGNRRLQRTATHRSSL